MLPLVVAEGSCHPCPPHPEAKPDETDRQTDQAEERQGLDLRQKLYHRGSAEQGRPHALQRMGNGQQLRDPLQKWRKHLSTAYSDLHSSVCTFLF